MKNYVNFTELSRVAGIEVGNGKYYRKIFPEFVIHKAKQNGRKLYDPQKAEVLIFIAKSYENGKTATEIREELSRKISAIYEVEADNFGKTETLPKNESESVINELIQVVKDNTEMIRHFSVMKTENDQLRKENEQLKRYILELEGNKALEISVKSKSWWQFWK